MLVYISTLETISSAVIMMLKNTQQSRNCVLAIAVSLTLLAQPVYARHERKIIGLIATTFIFAGSYYSSRYFSNDFGDYTKLQRFHSANPESPATGVEEFYHPQRRIISYTTTKNTMVPHATRISQIESWSRFDSLASNMKVRINQLLSHNDDDYEHWQFVHPGKPMNHFKRYMANLSAYCETGGIFEQNIILAFHAPNQDQIDFRNTCREWLDHTIDKTDLLIGSETNTPVVLAPVWKMKQKKLVPSPLIYFVLNPYFTPDKSHILYDEFPANLYLEGTDANEFLLYPLVAVFNRFHSTQLLGTPDLKIPGQLLSGGMLFSNFGARENMTVPYMLENRLNKVQYLIFRTINQLEAWPVCNTWSSNWSPLKVLLNNDRFSLTLKY